jgi:hypothetical protein
MHAEDDFSVLSSLAQGPNELNKGVHAVLMTALTPGGFDFVSKPKDDQLNWIAISFEDDCSTFSVVGG